MEKINIAMFSDSFYPIIGGRENVIHNLMNSISVKAPCFLATTTFRGHKHSITDKDLSYDVIRCKSVRITKNEYLSIIDKKFKKQIEEKIKNGKIDIIHVHTKYALLNYAFKLRKKYNIPIVTTVHTNYFEQYKKQLKFPPLYKLLLSRIKKVLQKVDSIFTVSNTMKNKLVKWGIDKEITVIPNGNDLIFPQNNDSIKQETKTHLNLGDENILLFVGRMVETKNLSFLFQVLHKLKEQNFSFKIIFVGGGNLNRYKKLSSKLNLDNECIFTGPITNREYLRNLYLTADLFINPSKIETFGLTTKEAGALSLPSIVIKDCATSENIIDNENGFISRENLDEFCSKIINAFNDKTKLKHIGQNAKYTFSSTWNEIADLHLTNYKKILINKEVL